MYIILGFKDEEIKKQRRNLPEISQKTNYEGLDFKPEFMQSYLYFLVISISLRNFL